MTMLSLFSGIGAFELSALKFGIKTLYQSEIELSAVSILKRHFSDVIQLGDVTKLSGLEIAFCDIITFGSPCQDLSVAGKRTGLVGERSNLFYEAIRIAKEMLEASNGRYPRFLIYENVAGMLNSNKGLDFCAVMDAIYELGFVVDIDLLDSQDFGVPQRRKRVFIVAENKIYRKTEYKIDVRRNRQVQQALDLWMSRGYRDTIAGYVSIPHTPIKSKLSDILEQDVDAKYNLSPKACTGIIRRAERRGKKLPVLLELALRI